MTTEYTPEKNNRHLLALGLIYDLREEIPQEDGLIILKKEIQDKNDEAAKEILEQKPFIENVFLKHYTFASNLQEKKLYAEARAEWSIIKEALFDDFWLFNHKIGECFWAEEQHESALSSFKAAIKNYPQSFFSHISIANCHLILNEFVLAEESFEHALIIQPQNLRLKNIIKELKKINLPEKLSQAEQNKEFAIQSLSEYLLENANSEWVLNKLTNLLYMEHNSQESKELIVLKEINSAIKLVEIILDSIEKKLNHE